MNALIIIMIRFYKCMIFYLKIFFIKIFKSYGNYIKGKYECMNHI